MRNKWNMRAISWILSVMMLVSSLGLDSLTVQAAESMAPGEEQSVVIESVSAADPALDEAMEPTVDNASEDATEENSTEAETAGEDAEQNTADEAKAAEDMVGNGFTYTAEFTADYTSASMDFTLKKVGDEDPSGSYYIHVYSRGNGVDEDFQQFAWNQGLSDQYKVTISNIQYHWQKLVPGVTYDLRVELWKQGDSAPIGDAVIPFTTKAVTVTPVEKQLTWFSAEYDFTVADKGQLKKDGIEALIVYPYLQKKGETTTQNVAGGGLDLLKDSLKLTNLADDTEYTVFMSAVREQAKPFMFSLDFKTSKDTRKVTISKPEVQYCYAKFNLSVTGGRDDVDTRSYVFLRKKGATEWNVWKNSNREAAFTREFRINELDASTEYEYVVAIGDDWNVNNPDEITKEGHKITGSFTTPADPRELNAVCSAGYQTALIQTSYTENNLEGVQTVIHAFVREVGTTDWVEKKNASYDQGNTFDLIFDNLKQNTEYEYRVILNSKWDRTTADDTVAPLQIKSGTFKTELCKYTLTMTPDQEKSVYNREYLNVQLTGSDRERMVSLKMLFSNEAEKSLNLYRDEKYKDTFSLKNLSSNTTYHLAQYELWVKEFGLDVCIAQVNCEENQYSFTTPVAKVPTKFTIEQRELYLNAAQPDEKNVGYVALKLKVDEGASDEAIWTTENPAVATVDENGKVTAVGVGSTKITATSKFDETVTGTVDVYVGSFAAYYVDGDKAVGDAVVKGIKGTQSPAIYVKGTEYNETEPKSIALSGCSYERNSVVSFDVKTGQITFGAVGTTKLYLENNGYKVRVNAESYIKTVAYYVSSLSNKNFPGVEVDGQENTYILLNGQDYQINLKSIDGEDIGDKNNFVITMDPDPNQSITINKLKLTTSDVVTTKPIKLTISPKEGSEYDNEYYSPAVIYLHVKALPTENEEVKQVYTNVTRYLSDVKLNSGWKWENEKVALYALRKTQDYKFKAYYAADDKYPISQNIKVNLAEIKNFAIEDTSNTKYMVTADGVDKIQVKVRFGYVGKIDFADLSKELKADSKDCTVTLKSFDNTFAIYEVSASKPGTYTLTGALRSNSYSDSIVSSSIVITATEAPLVRSIKVKETQKDAFIEDDELLFDATLDKNKTIDLKAIPFDYAENIITAPEFVWTTTDKTVAMITPASKTDTQNAKLLIKGEGNAIITVKSKDAAGVSYSFVVEVKNIAPHVDANKISVNTALNYEIGEGRDIAYKFNGFVELVEAYDNQVETWKFYKKTQKTFDKETTLTAADFNFYERIGVGNKRDILVAPKSNTKTGKYEMWLAVTTEASDTVYTYPVTVTVVNKPMKVKAVSDNINTFYMMRDNDNIAYTFTGDYIINPTVHWEDDTNNAIGFGIGKYVYYNETKKKWCSSVDTSALEMNGRTPAAGTTSGTLTFSFKGYREPVEIKNFKIKTSYKIPNITTVDASTTISMGCGIDRAAFYLYQKDAKQRIKFHDQSNKYFFSSYKCNIEEVEIHPTSDYSEYMEYVYSGNKKSEKLVITLRSNYWREKVEVKHTINNVDPTLVLEKSNMTFNWNLPGTDTTVLKVKKAQNGAVLKDVIVTGKNADAQKLIDENVFTFTMDNNRYLNVKLNHLKALNKKMNKDTTYSFDVKPVFVNPVSGKEVTGKACVLKVKTTSKAPAVNVSTSGSIDLAKYPMMDSWEFYKNSIKLKYSFANVNSNYEVISREVVGDYAKYFEIWWSDVTQSFHLVPKRGMEGKLKAGFVYNIQFKCTLKMKDGVTTEVVSKPYKLKLKQSSVGVKIAPKSQIIYLSNEKVTRVYEATLTNGYYRIDSITGSLDVNKDGKADFVIENVSKKSGDKAADITIKLVDRDAVSTTIKGKNYTIPLEVMVTGADGVTKNIKTSVTVTVKK